MHRGIFLMHIKDANKMHCFSTLFWYKQLYMFRTDLMSNIKSPDTVFTVLTFETCLALNNEKADSQHNLYDTA